ncbi:MAG: GlmU family protein [Chitinophagales bacterium]
MANKNFVLFDPAHVKNLLPLAFTRPVADFRVGVLTLREKWKIYLKSDPLVLTQDYLQDLFPFEQKEGEFVYINASVIPNENLGMAIESLNNDEVLKSERQEVIAFKTNTRFESTAELFQTIEQHHTIEYAESFDQIKHCWNIFQLNGSQIKADVALFKDEFINNSNLLGNALSVSNSNQIFIEDGAEIGACILNASKGPIVISKDAIIMDGAIIQGPVSIGEHAVIKMGAKIYGETTIGPHCKVGGEVSNSVLFAYSNKGHDGYLGNSVLGEWCNLGADTNNSNLKNNYSEIKCWSYNEQDYIKTGLQFCGLIMGDHCKSGINTMFNTGTVAGVAANIFGAGFPNKFIPSFSWGGCDGFSTFRLEKAYEMAKNMMDRRGIEFTAEHKAVFKHIFKETNGFRQLTPNQEYL